MPALITLTFLIVALGGLYSGRGRPAYWFVAAAMGLYLSGVLTLSEALGGLVNEGVVTLAILMVIAARIQDSGLLDRPMAALLNRAQQRRGGYINVLAPVALLSGFLNNTPIVAMLVHPVREWALGQNVAPSRYLLPLSYAAIIGGTLTLIGTSTNLVVFGLLNDLTDSHELTLFSPAVVGVPLLLVFFIYVAFAQRWLPNRTPSDTRPQSLTEFQIPARAGEALHNLSVSQAGLRHLKHGYLYRLHRDDDWQEVGAETRLKRGDRLVFLGSPLLIKELSLLAGIDFSQQAHRPSAAPTHLLEAVVPMGSELIGRTPKELGFRKRYGGVIVSVAHQTDQLFGKLGEYRFQAGDLLLLESLSSSSTPPMADLMVLNRYHSARSPSEQKKAYALLLAFPVMVIGGSLVGFALLQIALVYLGLCLLIGLARPGDLGKGLDAQLFGLLVGALALAQAVEKTGLADALTAQFADLLLPAWLAVLLIFAMTWLVTELLTNNSAAALILPFALPFGQLIGLSVEQIAITVMVAASTSFITPFGYQTNLMVLSPGNYKPLDYLRFGAPLVVLSGLVTVVMVTVWVG